MSLAVAIQMDPLETVDIDADSSFALALEAQGRGHGLYHYLPRQLSYRQGRIVATAPPVELNNGFFFKFGSGEGIEYQKRQQILVPLQYRQTQQAGGQNRMGHDTANL